MNRFTLVALLACSLATTSFAQITTIESAHSYGAVGNGQSDSPRLSANGRYVAFTSAATNLVAGDTNSRQDVFWHDRVTGATLRASLRWSGSSEPSYDSYDGAPSNNGRFVVFTTADPSMTTYGDSNGFSDVFRRDLLFGTTSCVSLRSNGNATGNKASYQPDVSADGGLVVFLSYATDLLASADTNNQGDVFLRDMSAGVTRRINLGPGGVQANGHSSVPRISADGAFVCFLSTATNLAVADLNGAQDVFLYEVATNTLSAVTVDPNTLIANATSYQPSLSFDGGFVAFTSSATNLVPGDTNGLVDAFVWDRSDSSFRRASVGALHLQGNGYVSTCAVSDDGDTVAFSSDATNLVVGDTNGKMDVFRHRFSTGVTERVSVASTGLQANNNSDQVGISGDGLSVVFASAATTLAPGLNGASQIFSHSPPCSSEITYCTAKTNSNGCVPRICSAGSPSLSGSDDFVVHGYRVMNLMSGILFWGGASATTPFAGGIRCVHYPVVRTPIQNSGGSTTTNDCTGEYHFAFTHAYMALMGYTPGQHVFAQWWSRDPYFPLPNNIGLTDAIEFVVTP